MGLQGQKRRYHGPAAYLEISPFSEGLAFVKPDENTRICIDKKGNQVFDASRWTSVAPFSEGLARVSVNSAEPNSRSGGSFPDPVYGFINTKGEVVIAPKWDFAKSFHEGLASVGLAYMLPGRTDGTTSGGNSAYAYDWNLYGYGYIDKTGALALYEHWGAASSFADGKAVVGGYAPLSRRPEVSSYASLEIQYTGEPLPEAPLDPVRDAQKIAEIKNDPCNILKSGLYNPRVTMDVPPEQWYVRTEGRLDFCDTFKINHTAHFRLSDMAGILNGSAKQFNFTYDEASDTLSITTGVPYPGKTIQATADPTIYSSYDSGPAYHPAVRTGTRLLVDGVAQEAFLYTVDGQYYFTWPRLAQLLDFDIDWHINEMSISFEFEGKRYYCHNYVLDFDTPYGGK